MLVIFGCDGLQTAVANGDTRTLALHHLHTNEDISITYKRNGKYDPEALKKLDWFVRDWRREESIKMDPHLYDLIWEVVRTTGGEKPVQVVCGYRAPATNAMLRRRSRGVAQQSQHTVGHAMDFYVPDVELSKLREPGLRLQRGGVGFYPTSGSPFVHLDTGSVRHWPRMTHDQLARVFPDGRTVHVPSDGVPLKNYALALADIEKRGSSSPSQMSLEAARGAGIAVADQPKKNLLAALFGAKDDDDDSEIASATPTPSPRTIAKPAQAGIQLASADSRPVALAEIKVAAAVPMPPVRPSRPQTVALAASSPSQIVASRGGWEGPTPAANATNKIKLATDLSAATRLNEPKPAGNINAIDVAWPVENGGQNDRVSPELALAYAAQPDRSSNPAPAGSESEQGVDNTVIRKATVKASAPARPVLAKAVGMPVAATSANDPWTRAAMFTPDIQNFMSVTVLGGAPDAKHLAPLMRKPTSVVMMTFSKEPLLGAITGRFTGNAVVFLPVVTLPTQTAALQ
jgi:uncharacterized protein YcbK (DUF882 family)